MLKLNDLLKKLEKEGIELGRVYTDKDRPAFKVNEGGPGSGPHGEDNPFDKEPTDDELADIEKEFEGINEVNFDKVPIPQSVKRYLVKLVQSMKDANLNRMKRSAILYQVIDATGMSPQQLMMDIQRIRKELK